MTKLKQLEKFIKENELTFEEGSRNSNATIICGFATFIEAELSDVLLSIPEKNRTEDLNIELERVFNYAFTNGYGKFWLKEQAKEQYIF